MDLQLNGKRALVTGSSAGIGEAIAKSIAAEGAAVIVHGRNADRAEAVAAAIRNAGGQAEVALGDLSSDEGANAVANAALAGRPVDILVNNAGSYDPTTWDDATSELWIKTYESDVVSAVRLTQALTPGMRERGWGRVIFIGSGSGWQPFATQPQYCAAKGAMVAFLASPLSRFVSGANWRVNGGSTLSVN